MTKDNSPENLLKFLESDDSALVIMGLSMTKNIDIPEELNNVLLEISMWDKDQSIKKKASEIIIKKLPNFKKKSTFLDTACILDIVKGKPIRF